MFSSARLKSLHERKQKLLVRCEVQRRLCAMECAEVQERLAWLDRTVASARRVLPLWGVVAPLWRLWSSRRAGAGTSWFGKIAAVLPIARQLAEIWNLFSQQRNEHRPIASKEPDLARPATA